MSPERETSTQLGVLSQAAMQAAKEETDLLVRSPPWWSIPHSMRYWLPLGRVTKVPSDDGQEVTVDVAEALELVPDAV